MEEKEHEEKISSMGINQQTLQGDKGKLLTEITMNLTQKFKAEMQKNNKGLNDNEMKIEKAISKEIESNTCPVCLELMLPPEHSPMLLFPCGHTFCKGCLLKLNPINARHVENPLNPLILYLPTISF